MSKTALRLSSGKKQIMGKELGWGVFKRRAELTRGKAFLSKFASGTNGVHTESSD